MPESISLAIGLTGHIRPQQALNYNVLVIFNHSGINRTHQVHFLSLISKGCGYIAGKSLSI